MEVNVPIKKAEVIDEIRKLMDELDISVDELKEYIEKGYQPNKIGFLG